jgi:hypothetical protein
VQNFRVDAIRPGKNGDVAVLTAHHFQATTVEEAEKIADEWVKVRGLDQSKATALRIVRNEMIESERLIFAVSWARSAARRRFFLRP